MNCNIKKAKQEEKGIEGVSSEGFFFFFFQFQGRRMLLVLFPILYSFSKPVPFRGRKDLRINPDITQMGNQDPEEM